MNLLQDFMAGKLPGLQGEYPTLNDWENHLTTIFPEVRIVNNWVKMSGCHLHRFTDFSYYVTPRLGLKDTWRWGVLMEDLGGGYARYLHFGYVFLFSVVSYLFLLLTRLRLSRYEDWEYKILYWLQYRGSVLRLLSYRLVSCMMRFLYKMFWTWQQIGHLRKDKCLEIR